MNRPWIDIDIIFLLHETWFKTPTFAVSTSIQFFQTPRSTSDGTGPSISPSASLSKAPIVRSRRFMAPSRSRSRQIYPSSPALARPLLLLPTSTSMLHPSSHTSHSLARMARDATADGAASSPQTLARSTRQLVHSPSTGHCHHQNQ